MMLSVSVPTFISFYTSLPLGNYGYFPHYGGQLIHKDQFVGYYGHIKAHSYVRITDNIDLQTLFSRAQAKGYDAAYHPTTITLSSSEEHYVISRMHHISLIADYLGVWCNRGGNETSFDYAVPVWIRIDCQETSEDWFESNLREFFPNLSDQEYSDFAWRLASGYNTINISESPDWTSIKNYLGAFDYVSCVPISEVYEYYSNGKITYGAPSIVIKHTILLEADKPVTFVVWMNGWGFVKIEVESEYLLYERWIRENFFTIFFDVGLPPDVIWEFTVEENYYITYD